MWRMFSHDRCLQMSNKEIGMEKLSCFVGKSVLSQFSLFCREICFVALLCGEKLNQEVVLVEKKRQISGMIIYPMQCLLSVAASLDAVSIVWLKNNVYRHLCL